MRKIVFLFILIILSAIAIFLPKDPFSEKEVLFKIDKGEGSREIALNLEKNGLIWWSPIFRLYVLTVGISDKLQAGKYLLSSSMNIPTLAGQFSQGKIATIKITIPEGFTADKIQARIKNLTGLDMLGLAEKEGYLFPDTYEISYDATEEEIVQMILANFNKKTANLEITPEIVVMASLLEKEVKTKEEKELAAGILWKRLRIGMPLQVDAEMWTYENPGLPPKPIANPGLDSIGAALYPKDSEYWYYLSTPEGETIFSKTLEEHNDVKSKYLK